MNFRLFLMLLPVLVPIASAADFAAPPRQSWFPKAPPLATPSGQVIRALRWPSYLPRPRR